MKLSLININDINTILRFLSKRDLQELTPEALFSRYGIYQVDLLILLGNSMPITCEITAKAYREGLAKEIMIVGGIGHSTKYLVQNVKQKTNLQNILTADKSEAEILCQIMLEKEGISPNKILLETQSTNCGSNAKEALNLLRKKEAVPNSLLLIQDPTMQLRTEASFIKEWSKEKTLILSHAPFIPQVELTENGFVYEQRQIEGLWEQSRLIDLIMGEIPRLIDDEYGYGPKGKGFISSVEVPLEVINAYQKLLITFSEYGDIKNRS